MKPTKPGYNYYKDVIVRVKLEFCGRLSFTSAAGYGFQFVDKTQDTDWHGPAPTKEEVREMKEALNRSAELLRATSEFIRNNPVSDYTVHYDGTECDACCLSDDCMIAVEAIDKARGA